MMATTPVEHKLQSSTAAPLSQQILQQVKFELLMTARRGENVLVTIILPVILLIFFTSLKIDGKTVNTLLPGILAIAIIAAGMVNLGIATAYERYYGVLKRLGASPLPRSGLIIAKIISILILEVVQGCILCWDGNTALWLATSGLLATLTTGNRARYHHLCRTRASNGWCIAGRSNAGWSKCALSTLSVNWGWYPARRESLLHFLQPSLRYYQQQH